MRFLIVFLLICSPCYALNLADSCLAYYKLDENAASVEAIDERGGSGTGVRNTNLYAVAGKIGGALDFDGADDKIDTGSNFIGTQPITICAWIYPQGWGEGGSGSIVDNNGNSIWTSQGTTGLAFWRGTTARNSGTGTITLNRWTFACVTSTEEGITTFYIDGKQSGIPNQSVGAVKPGSQNVHIGNNATQAATFDGYIDNVMIFNRILTPHEINRLYNGGEGIGSLSTLE
jgi:hypothetical protein